jgi:hypothetical protein
MSDKQILNKLFFGCNYNDKKLKAQFDNLKLRIEKNIRLRYLLLI